MKILFLVLFALSGSAFATNGGGECRGNCNDIPPVGDVSQEQGQAQSSENTNVNANLNDNSNDVDVRNTNTNLNTSESNSAAVSGSASYSNAEGGSSDQSQSQSADNNGNSQNINIDAPKTYRYANNVNAFAPAIYSSSACTAGGVSGAASALGVGIALGGARQDPQCQVRENARILSGLDANLAILYLCANPAVDVGTVLGSACRPPVIVVPPVVMPEHKPEIPVQVIEKDVKG